MQATTSNKRSREEVYCDSGAVVNHFWQLLSGVPECFNKIGWFYHIKRRELQTFTAKNIDFEVSTIKKLSLSERIAALDYLYKVDSMKVISRHVYQKMCQAAFPMYTTNRDPEILQYWDKYHELMRATFPQNSMYPFVDKHLADNINIYNTTYDGIKTNFNMCNYAQKLYIERIVEHSRHKYRHTSEAPVIHSTQNRLIARLLRTSDIDANFRDTFIAPLCGSHSPILNNEIGTMNKDLLNLGLAIANDTTYWPKSFNVTYRKHFTIINARFNERLLNYDHADAPGLRYIKFSRVPEKREDIKELNKLFPYTSKVDKLHMVTNVAAFVFSYLHPSTANPFTRGETSNIRMMKLNDILKYVAIGTNQVLTLTVLMTALGHTHSGLVIEHIVRAGILYRDDVDKKPIFKSLSNAVRRTQRLPDGTQLDASMMSALCYYELAFGRSVNTTDWQNEIAERSTNTRHIQWQGIQTIAQPNDEYHIYFPEGSELRPKLLVEDEKFYDVYTNHVRDIMLSILREREITETFTDFCKRRNEWCVAGSSGGEKVYIPPDSGLFNAAKPIYNVNADKRAYMETLTTQDMVKFMHDPPIEAAHGSEKFENGKSRSIYGVTVPHYVINSYVTDGFEALLHNCEGIDKGLTGIKEFASQQKLAGITVKGVHECSMLDYADFNVQHSPRAQAILFTTLAEIGIDREYPQDWIDCAEWLALAKYDSRFTIPGDSTMYPAKQGMFSGTKSTDFINTIANRAYFLTAMQYVRDNYNVVPEDLHTVHQGDDVWVSNKKRHWAALMFYTMANMGFEFNIYKQMFGQGFGEFLRVLYNPKGGIGYAVRSIVNYILRPLQNRQAVDVKANCQSLSATYQVMQRRGMTISILNDLYDTDLLWWAAVRANRSDIAPRRIPAWIIQTPSVDGGFGCPRPGTIFIGDVDFKPTPKLSLKLYKGNHKLPSHMSNDWIEHVSAKLPETDRILNITSLRGAMFKTNYFHILRETGFGYNTEKYKRDWVNWVEEHSNYGTSNSHADPSIFNYIIIDPDNIKQSLITGLLNNRFRRENLELEERNILINLKADLKSTTLRENTLRSMIHRIYVNSTFKSISTTAVALNVTHEIATMWIIEHCLNPSMADAEETKMVLDIISRKNGQALIDWLCSSSFAYFECVLGFINPAVILHCVAVAKEAFVYRYHQRQEDIPDFYTKSFINRVVNLIDLFVSPQLSYQVYDILY